MPLLAHPKFVIDTAYFKLSGNLQPESEKKEHQSVGRVYELGSVRVYRFMYDLRIFTVLQYCF